MARPSEVGAHAELNSPVVPAKAGTQGSGGGRSTAANPAHPEPSSTVVPAKSLPRTRYGAGTQRGGGARNTAANPAHPEPSSTVIPAPTPSFPRKRESSGAAGAGAVAPQLETKNPRYTTAARTQDPRTRSEGRRSSAHERPEHRSEKDEKPAARGAHHRRAQQRKTRTALARARPLWRTHRLRNTRPLAPPMTATRLHY